MATDNSPPRSNPPNPMLQSTPQSRVLPPSARILTPSVYMSNVRPWIIRDVEKFTECSVDTMLKVFIEDCINKSPSPDTESLFKQLLEKMVDICNGKFQRNDLKAKSSNIKENPKSYSESSKKVEAALYPHFVSAVNTALLYLELVDVPGTRPCSSPICFHVNDPSFLKQTHQGQLSERKPDIVVVSESDASNHVADSTNGILERDDFLPKAATKPPGSELFSNNETSTLKPTLKLFEWRNVRMFVEFKISTKKMAKPPSSYPLSSQRPLPKPQYLTMDQQVEENDVPQSEGLPAAPASANANSQPPADVVFNCLLLGLHNPAQTVVKGRLKVLIPNPNNKSAGGYAAEMFAAHTGRQHVLGLVVVGDLLYIWRYDRQGAIQCSALNFIEDLPRFLVLLFAMQRFQDCHWGLNPNIDPKFEPCSRSPTMTFHDQQGKETDIELELSSDERRTHFGLNGRATNVFPATSETLSSEGPLIAKVFWAEESRKSEPDILQKVYEIAGNNNVKGRDDVEGHVPAMVCYQKYLHTSTALIRKRLSLNVNGSRVLYVIVFRKLEPITALTGDDFLRAWWDTVGCHFVLWTNGVRHRDVSPSNLMYRIVNGKIVGVLNDFDLASLGGGVTGTERTGTVPFMALDLLTEEALTGEVTHLYEHDAESFIWVLTWISLRYSNGQPMKNKALDQWLIVDAVTCGEKKLAFLDKSGSLLDNKNYPPGKGHELHLRIAQTYLAWILPTRVPWECTKTQCL
ncbi:hypothetical protein F5I97DRAFT_1828322 [Phlebopus sp. FC_14]|nr:hypothetical protein F5I97DRAFT_1828322 [Phlebopus sp. FC_14]